MNKMEVKKMKTKSIRAILILAIILAAITIVSPLISSSKSGLFNWIPIAYAGDQGNSTGTATVGNAAPTATLPMLVNAAEDTNENDTGLSVQTEYRCNVTISDGNTLNNLKNVTCYIFEDTAVNWDSADANATHMTFLYSNSTNAFTEVGPGHRLTIGSCAKPADRTATSGVYKFVWNMSKVANHTGTNSWRINFTAFDGSDDTANVQTLVFGVNFYIEITVDDATHAWAGLSAGDTDVKITSPVDLDIDCTVTANGLFNMTAKSFNASLTSGTDTFAIGNVTIHKDTLLSSIPLTTNYAGIVGLTQLAAVEAGNEAFTLWIDVPAGQVAGSYVYVLGVQGIEA
jgi:hypothetical protein